MEMGKGWASVWNSRSVGDSDTSLWTLSWGSAKTQRQTTKECQQSKGLFRNVYWANSIIYALEIKHKFKDQATVSQQVKIRQIVGSPLPLFAQCIFSLTSMSFKVMFHSLSQLPIYLSDGKEQQRLLFLHAFSSLPSYWVLFQFFAVFQILHGWRNISSNMPQFSMKWKDTIRWNLLARLSICPGWAGRVVTSCPLKQRDYRGGSSSWALSLCWEALATSIDYFKILVWINSSILPKWWGRLDNNFSLFVKLLLCNRICSKRLLLDI